MKNMKFFFYGDKAYGKKMIAKLIQIGAINTARLSGVSEDKVYFTNDEGMICSEFADSRKGEVIINTYNEIAL